MPDQELFTEHCPIRHEPEREACNWRTARSSGPRECPKRPWTGLPHPRARGDLSAARALRASAASLIPAHAGTSLLVSLDAYEDVSLNGNVKLYIEMSEADWHGN